MSKYIGHLSCLAGILPLKSPVSLGEKIAGSAKKAISPRHKAIIPPFIIRRSFRLLK